MRTIALMVILAFVTPNTNPIDGEVVGDSTAVEIYSAVTPVIHSHRLNLWSCDDTDLEGLSMLVSRLSKEN